MPSNRWFLIGKKKQKGKKKHNFSFSVIETLTIGHKKFSPIP